MNIDDSMLPADDRTALHGERAWVAGVLDALPDPVLVVDQALQVTGANTAAQDLLQLSATGLVGRPLAAVLPASHGGVLERVREAVRDGVPGTRPPRSSGRTAAGSRSGCAQDRCGRQDASRARC